MIHPASGVPSDLMESNATKLLTLNPIGFYLRTPLISREASDLIGGDGTSPPMWAHQPLRRRLRPMVERLFRNARAGADRMAEDAAGSVAPVGGAGGGRRHRRRLHGRASDLLPLAGCTEFFLLPSFILSPYRVWWRTTRSTVSSWSTRFPIIIV